MTRPRRRNFQPDEKVRILREHLIEGRAVSEVCDAFGLRPSQFYQWQAMLFENGASAFRKDREREVSSLRQQIDRLQERLTQKDRGIAEISEEYVAAKKASGAI
jgi:transposase